MSFIYSSSFSPLIGANQNVKHNPRKIFENHPGGESTVKITKATGADLFHAKGIKGRVLKIAVIDGGFHPKQLKPFIDKGLIHPSVLQNRFVLTPDEQFDDLNIPENPSTAQLEKALCAGERKEYLLRLELANEEGGYSTHGFSVMQTLHSMAPEAQLLPMDIGIMYTLKSVRERGTDGNKERQKIFTAALREATKQGVDAINISCVLDPDQELIDAFRDASQKGIAVICAAGNSSSKTNPVFLDKCERTTGMLTPSKHAEILKGTKNKYILFAGGVTYQKTGKETFYEPSIHPTSSFLSHYLLASGAQIQASCYANNIQCSMDGTSAAAPITAGGFALLKHYAQSKGLTCTNEELLRILYKSGHTLTHGIPHTYSKNYKVLDLKNALTLVDKTVRKKSPSSHKPAVSAPSHVKNRPSRAKRELVKSR